MGFSQTRNKLASESLPLRGVLDEFRTALREEILAAQRSSSSNAVQLKNGRRIAGASASFQYAFAVDSVLNAPGDAPGHLIVPEKGRVPTTIISTEGLTITISLGIDLGSFVPSARLETDLTFLLEKLIERVEALNGKSNCAGDRILGFAAVSGAPELLSVKGFNPEQNDAIASSLGRYDFHLGPGRHGKNYNNRRDCCRVTQAAQIGAAGFAYKYCRR